MQGPQRSFPNMAETRESVLLGKFNFLISGRGIELILQNDSPKFPMDFSIVTPTFKQPNWVRLCVASILDQEEVTVEHIIQDGGDGLGLDSLRDDPRISHYVEKDTGMYDGVVNGLRKAKGEFVAHLNSDEQYLPGALKTVKEFFVSHPDVDVVFGDAILVNQDGKPLSYRRVVKPLRAHILACHLGTLTCSAFFRRSLVERGLSYTSHFRQIEDAAMVLRWIDAGIKMAVFSRPLAVFTFTGENMSTGTEPKEEGLRLRAANRLLKTPIPSRLEYKILAPILAVHHRIRKLLHGAYQPRNLELRIYTLSSPHARQAMRVGNLGFGWPKAEPGLAA